MKSIRTKQVGRRQMLLQTLALAGVAAGLGACTRSGMSGPEKPIMSGMSGPETTSMTATSGGASGGGDSGGGLY